TERYPEILTDIALPRHQLLEIHRSKISLHRAKADYNYPAIRLPYKFSMLAGLPTRIFQMMHGGALAFLVVISPNETTSESSESSALTWRRSPVRIRPIPSFFCESPANYKKLAENNGSEDFKVVKDFNGVISS
ncbi:MAG: hypothetical protein WCA89_09280, partial [Terracidiphilus sp.]